MQNQILKYLITLLKPAFIIAALIVVLASYQFIMSRNLNINLASAGFWQDFPGVEITDNGIHFQPLGRIIVHQDGSNGQPNPPVNLSGQHLKVNGDFRITAVLIDVDKQASLRFYSALPTVYDQWRHESPSIDITIDKASNFLIAKIWDGTSSNSMDMRSFKILPVSKIIVSLEYRKDQINIFVNNKILGSMPDHNIFSSGSVWFGADGAYKSTGWTLASLDAEAAGNGSVKIVSAPSLIVNQSGSDSLRNLADTNFHKIKIGSAVSIARLLTDEQYKEIALGQFSMLTPENSMKPQFIHPEPNTYVFEEADQLVNAALLNGMIVHGHTLIYDKSTPDWMVNAPKEQRQNIMVSHIKNVVSHFKGKVSEWDVVNEPFSQKHALYKNGKTGLEPNIWFTAMGEKYIDLAFRTAHDSDPLAKLYLNDYGVENDGQHWDALLNLVKRLQQRGVPIDGVGFEAHVYNDGDYINPVQLKKHMEALNKLGLLTRISEIDVTGDNPEEQVKQYETVLDICLRQSNCTSYTTWGITDKYGSTTRSDRYPLVYGSSLLWDKDMKAKPAYVALQKRLKQ